MEQEPTSEDRIKKVIKMAEQWELDENAISSGNGFDFFKSLIVYNYVSSVCERGARSYFLENPSSDLAFQRELLEAMQWVPLSDVLRFHTVVVFMKMADGKMDLKNEDTLGAELGNVDKYVVANRDSIMDGIWNKVQNVRVELL